MTAPTTAPADGGTQATAAAFQAGVASGHTYTAEMAHAAALRGAKWLDKRCPDWLTHIDLDVLDLGKNTRCVLGQTATCLLPDSARTYSPTFHEVHDHYAGTAEGWAARYGFDVLKARHVNEYSDAGFREYRARYEMLTIAWRQLIAERLEAPQ